MHLAGRGYSGKLENPRGPRWWGAAAREIAPFLDEARRELLASELEFQARHRALDLPRGPVHAICSATTSCSRETGSAE